MANLTPVPQPAATQITALHAMLPIITRIARLIEALQTGQFQQLDGTVLDLSFGTTGNTNAITALKTELTALATQGSNL